MEGESIISLFGKVVKGDEAAFRLLFETYSRRLFHVAYYYLNSRELAEEAIMDVFTVIWQKRETLSHVKEPERNLYIGEKPGFALSEKGVCTGKGFLFFV